MSTFSSPGITLVYIIQITVAVFTWARITFRKTFRIAIQKRDWDRDLNYLRSHAFLNHDQDLRTAYCAVRAR